MRGSRNFRRGGGGVKVSLTKKALTTFFLVLSLFYRSQTVNSKEIYRFQGFRGGPTLSRGSNFFQGGGVQLLIPYRNPYIACDFPGGGSGPPVPPSGSALGMQLVCTSKNIWAELSYEFGPSCLINLGRVLCGPTWHGPNWFWAELSVILCDRGG